MNALKMQRTVGAWPAQQQFNEACLFCDDCQVERTGHVTFSRGVPAEWQMNRPRAAGRAIGDVSINMDTRVRMVVDWTNGEERMKAWFLQYKVNHAKS